MSALSSLTKAKLGLDLGRSLLAGCHLIELGLQPRLGEETVLLRLPCLLSLELVNRQRGRGGSVKKSMSELDGTGISNLHWSQKTKKTKKTKRTKRTKKNKENKKNKKKLPLTTRSRSSELRVEIKTFAWTLAWTLAESSSAASAASAAWWWPSAVSAASATFARTCAA